MKNSKNMMHLPDEELSKLNTSIIVHPKLKHYGLMTTKLDSMVDWYQKVLGMTVNNRSAVPAGTQNRAPFSAMTFVSNDEADHRIVFFEIPEIINNPEKNRLPGLQHVAFEYRDLDELLGTYVRLKNLGILPVCVADQGVGMCFYYEDPDQNIVELNVNNYGNDWTATEHIKKSQSMERADIDPEKLIDAHKKGASLWELHQRALAREFIPEKSM
ncbi:MAG TPA: VOC family protein [Candidatus Acidoferrum sp.]|nr:VOC family protein [Candidatus Acidoferrum sp.]